VTRIGGKDEGSKEKVVLGMIGLRKLGQVRTSPRAEALPEYEIWLAVLEQTQG